MKRILARLVMLAASTKLPEPGAGDSVQGCADGGLYLISVRGTTEEPGIGVAGSVFGRKVQSQIKGTKIVALDYPASFTGPSYGESVAMGTQDLTDLISEHVKACPHDKMAILGYSQGAQVTLNTLCGTDEPGFPDTAAIASDKVEKHIVAVALFGDPTHVGDAGYNKGTSTRNGAFARENTDQCLKYANMIGSWCDTGDVYCDRGNVTGVHARYFSKYGSEVVKFIVDKARDSKTPTSSDQPAGSRTGEPAATTSKTKENAADGVAMASRGLCVALPAMVAVLFQLV